MNFFEVVSRSRRSRDPKRYPTENVLRLTVASVFFAFGILIERWLWFQQMLTNRVHSGYPARLAYDFTLDYAPDSIFMLLQDLLLAFPLSPYAVLVGAVHGLCSASERFPVSVAIATGYSISSVLGHHLTETDVIFAIYAIALIPTTFLGFTTGRYFRRRRFPQFALRDFLVLVSFTAMLARAVYLELAVANAMLICFGLTYLAYSTRIPPKSLPLNAATHGG